MTLSIKLSGKILLLLYFVFHSMNAFPDWPKTERDFSLLPPYCKARLKSPVGSQDQATCVARGTAHPAVRACVRARACLIIL